METTCGDAMERVGISHEDAPVNCTLQPNATCCTVAEVPTDGWIFDRTDVKVILVVAYTFVFCCCFFGNLLVISVVCLNRRMRTTTNFFLTNLAFADLCVAMFCVYQNLFFYLTPQWVFGDFLCRMYHFVHGLSYTASILILTIICVERYIAIVHPMWNKQVVTMTRLRFAIVTVWFISAAYCSPRIVMYGTVEAVVGDTQEALCVMQRALYNSKTYDLVNFVVCFVIPLIVISVLYTIICYHLWHGPTIVAQRRKEFTADLNNQCKSARCKACVETTTEPSRPRCQEYTETLVTQHSRAQQGSTVTLTVPFTCNECSTLSCAASCRSSSLVPPLKKKKNCPLKVSSYSNACSALRPRRKVIRLLVVVVFSFAMCNLPFHARKLWQYWSTEYNGSSTTAAILTVVTNLVLYLNSGLNPFLYALFSKNFRKSMADLLFCRAQRKRLKSRSSFQAMSKSLNSGANHSFSAVQSPRGQQQ
ncbi:trissin receptor-like [Ornithodoros turicata]|uniref:trissin receptor-like n=1 Tax=Ornithodoros turicata TaxID=34597 RepID=UPI00313882F0